MNRKQLLVIVIIGIVLGAVGVYLNRQKSGSFEHAQKTAASTLLGDFPINDIAQITIHHDTNSVNLARNDTAWTVRERAGYPADSSQIVEFARKLWDLRAAQSQKIGESQLGRLNLLDPARGGTNSATLVELKSKDGKLIRSVRLGKESMRETGDSMGGGWPNGRWICLPDKPGTAYLISETFANIEPKPEQWLDKSFIRVEKAKSIDVAFPAATNSWKLTRDTETAAWKLADARTNEVLDSSKVAGVSNPLSSPTFNDVMPGTKLEGTGTNAPTVVTIDTFDHFHYVATVGGKTNSDYPMTVAVTAQLTKERVPGKDEKPADKAKLDKDFKDRLEKLEGKLKQEEGFGKWTYLVSSWSVDPLLKPRADLLEVKKEEPKNAFGTNAVSSVKSPQIEDPPLPAIHSAN